MSKTLLPIEDIHDDDEFDAPNDDLVVYSRDWTVQTIISQIEQGNIDLNPKFQRRNAWKDDKRIRLIESLLLRYPVPEIVLAESKEKKRSFVVIDGKQRLQTIAGLYIPDTFKIWDSKKFGKSKSIPKLSGAMAKDLFEDPTLAEYKRLLDNADIRCTIVSNYSSDEVLYDIFYRLNSGSSPLSSQELRQVLNKGNFSEFIQEYTNTPRSIHLVLEIEKADDRLVDIDLMLRCLAFYEKSSDYKGSQKAFLDSYVTDKNQSWDSARETVINNTDTITKSIDFLGDLIGYKHIGRKPESNGNGYDWRFNKILFEVQVLFSTNLDRKLITPELSKKYQENLFLLVNNDPLFRASIESTTKSLERYRTRFEKYGNLIKEVFGNEVSFKNQIREI